MPTLTMPTTDLSGIAVLKPRVQPHSDRYGGLREWPGPVQGVCWHTTEGGENRSSAEALASMMRLSKVQAGGNFAAYHYIVDADSIIPLCREEQEPYAQGGANDALISVCVTGKAGQSAEQWADEMSHPALLNMALVTSRICIAHGIPVRRVFGAGLRAGWRGICGHVDVRDAYHKTTHTDPGLFFPWSMMLDLVFDLVNPAPEPDPTPPQEDDDMRLARKDGKDAVWLTNGFERRWMRTQADVDHAKQLFGLPDAVLLPSHADLTNALGVLVGDDPGDV